MLVCVDLTSLLILVLGMLSVGPGPALIASLGFLAYPDMAYYANHAMSEAVVDVGYFGWARFLAVAEAAGWALSTRVPVLRFLALWSLIALLLVTWWIPFAWMRYLTPLLVPSLLLGAWALWGVVALFWKSTAKSLAGTA